MYQKRRLCFLPLAAVLLAAGVPSWKEKAVSQWDADDAKQLLADSPWVKQPHSHTIFFVDANKGL